MTGMTDADRAAFDAWIQEMGFTGDDAGIAQCAWQAAFLYASAKQEYATGEVTRLRQEMQGAIDVLVDSLGDEPDLDGDDHAFAIDVAAELLRTALTASPASAESDEIARLREVLRQIGGAAYYALEVCDERIELDYGEYDLKAYDEWTGLLYGVEEMMSEEEVKSKNKLVDIIDNKSNDYNFNYLVSDKDIIFGYTYHRYHTEMLRSDLSACRTALSTRQASLDNQQEPENDRTDPARM